MSTIKHRSAPERVHAYTGAWGLYVADIAGAAHSVLVFSFSVCDSPYFMSTQFYVGAWNVTNRNILFVVECGQLLFTV